MGVEGEPLVAPGREPELAPGRARERARELAPGRAPELVPGRARELAPVWESAPARVPVQESVVVALDWGQGRAAQAQGQLPG